MSCSNNTTRSPAHEISYENFSSGINQEKSCKSRQSYSKVIIKKNAKFDGGYHSKSSLA